MSSSPSVDNKQNRLASPSSASQTSRKISSVSKATQDDDLQRKIKDLQSALNMKETLIQQTKNDQLIEEFEKIKKELAFTSSSVSGLVQKSAQQAEVRQRAQDRLNATKAKLREEETLTANLSARVEELRKFLLESHSSNKEEFELRLKAVEKILGDNKRKNEELKQKINTGQANEEEGSWSISTISHESEKERIKQEEMILTKGSQMAKSAEHSIAQNM